MSYALANRTVLITGASSGIGRATAAAFHRAGCQVVATARRSELLQSLKDELGDRVSIVPGDITLAEGRAAAMAAARSAFGQIDILVNNAGWASFGTVERMPQDHIDRMLALNLAAPIALTQAVLPEMIDRGHGQIINISSVVGNQAIPRMTIYSATKAALTSFSTGLRMELRGTGIDVILVAPGSTNTAFFTDAASVDARAERVASTQYTADRVAAAVVRSSRIQRAEVTLTAEGKAMSAIRRVSHRLADQVMYQYAKKGMPVEKPAQHGS
ncbi:MAG: SDR family NAD(P)-dependent oxidoreductase [Planctomycetota bacterium]|jgi:short-subunit dehydrogenase